MIVQRLRRLACWGARPLAPGLDFAIVGSRLSAIRLMMIFLRANKIAAVGSGVYLLAVACAWIYPVFDHRTFSGLPAVLRAWPWIDHLPSRLLPLAIALNAVLIFVLLLSVRGLARLLRPSTKRVLNERS